ncbi:MAG: peptidoglycan-associated lipoprotein Pal [Candidatus Nitrotoga sp.]|nr:peptidoglycan-associated lipoprotein Pal [Candidatus Nitrotoga sp.]MDP1855760.1 peptidoglycan-associated lipoprotein Pal [Candidatus Nitrotoga sp.]
MKNIVIGVLLASLLVACASDEPPVGDLKKRGRAAGAPMSAAVDSAPGASVAVDTLNDQNGVSQTSESVAISAGATDQEAAAKAAAEEAALAATRAAEVQNAELEAARVAAARAAEVHSAELEAARVAAAKAAAEEAALAAARAAEVHSAELEAAKAAAAQAAADAAAAREAASAAAAREVANAAKVAAELEAVKASAAQAAAEASAAREAANVASAQNAAKANAARDAAKAAIAREVVAEDSLGVPSSLLAKRSIYYPIDMDAVPEQDKRTVQAHAKYLAEHQNRLVRLEGHADERGSSEYNLALGQRRADGVKKALLVGGAKENQIESVSYGEEKPMSTAHNEAAWSQNRRTDLNYNAK